MTATEKLTQRVGQMLKGRYRIDHELHMGAESTVYAGMDLKSGRVAVKVFERPSDPSVLSRSYLANAVGHPSAVNVLDSGSSDDGALFVVLELIEASSMAELMRKHDGHLPVRMACNIADQALDLLASAHVQGIVHGELTIEKLFCARNDQLKVLGFGQLIATAADASAAQTPEQSAAYAGDVRSLARIIAQLLVGKPVDVLLAAEPGSSGKSTQPELPRRIASVIQKGLTRDAAQHWQSARAMRTALQLACRAELGRPVDRDVRRMVGEARKENAKEKPRRRRAGRGVWLAAAGAFLGSMFVLREFVSPSAPLAEVDQEIDVAPATAPVAQAQDGEAEPTRSYANDATRAASEPVTTQPTRIVPRKPPIPALRAPLKARAPALPTNIAPASPLCSQLGAARRVRTLNEEETQLWAARCGTP